jgi:hypothetical protein
MAIKKAKADAVQARSAWLALVAQTLDEISGWARAERWAAVRHEKQIEEQALGTYSVAVLTIQLPSGHLHVEPIARYVAGAEGRIDLLSFPVLNRVTLLRKGDTWVARTDSGVVYPRSWNRRTFVKLAQELASST